MAIARVGSSPSLKLLNTINGWQEVWRALLVGFYNFYTLCKSLHHFGGDHHHVKAYVYLDIQALLKTYILERIN